MEPKEIIENFYQDKVSPSFKELDIQTFNGLISLIDKICGYQVIRACWSVLNFLSVAEGKGLSLQNKKQLITVAETIFNSWSKIVPLSGDKLDTVQPPYRCKECGNPTINAWNEFTKGVMRTIHVGDWIMLKACNRCRSKWIVTHHEPHSAYTYYTSWTMDDNTFVEMNKKNSLDLHLWQEIQLSRLWQANRLHPKMLDYIAAHRQRSLGHSDMTLTKASADKQMELDLAVRPIIYSDEV